MSLGGITVPGYTTSNEDEISYQEMRNYALNSPEIIHMKVQNFLEISSKVGTYKGRK